MYRLAEEIQIWRIDHGKKHVFGEPVHFTTTATYSIGFFGFWVVCAASSLMTWFLQRSAAEVNKGVGADSGAADGSRE